MSTCWKWESSGRGGGNKIRNYGSIVQVELTKLNSLLGRTDQQKKKRVRRWMIRGKVCRYEVSCQDFWGMLHLPRICCCRAVGKGQRLFSCCWISHQQQSLPSPESVAAALNSRLRVFILNTLIVKIRYEAKLPQQRREGERPHLEFVPWE